MRPEKGISKSVTSVVGVYPAAKHDAFRAAISFKCEDIHLGYYHIEEEAIAARVKAEKIKSLDIPESEKLCKLLEIAAETKDIRKQRAAAGAGYRYTLMKEIADWYAYDLKIDKDGTTVLRQGNETTLPYKNVDSALKDWVLTLEESNADMVKSGNPILWDEAIIDFIRSL